MKFANDKKNVMKLQVDSKMYWELFTNRKQTVFFVDSIFSASEGQRSYRVTAVTSKPKATICTYLQRLCKASKECLDSMKLLTMEHFAKVASQNKVVFFVLEQQRKATLCSVSSWSSPTISGVG